MICFSRTSIRFGGFANSPKNWVARSGSVIKLAKKPSASKENQSGCKKRTGSWKVS